MFDKDFYPTPDNLIIKMWFKVKNRGAIETVLEPSAGKGDIVKYIKENYSYSISCIEKNEDLQNVLRGQGFRVIDSDFLNYSGLDKFDLIIGNPPFSDGAEHLLKAIDILYSGQIVFLINAETIKNPYSNVRKDLVQKLTDLNADIEYVQNAFIGAERKTAVEVAIVHIIKERRIEFDLFDDCSDAAKEQSINLEENSELAHRNGIEFLVEEFNATVNEGIESILYYYKHPRIHTYIRMSPANEDRPRYGNSGNLNHEVSKNINEFLKNIRISYWKRVLDLDEVRKRMTEKKKIEFYDQIEKQSEMDFTESNIRAFIIKLIGNYENILTEAVAEIFDRMTQQYTWHEECQKNIHYYNGWKTNKAFYVNKKVILPIYRGFRSWSGRSWEVPLRSE